MAKKVRIGKLKEQARNLSGADPLTALKIVWRLVDVAPQDIENHVMAADILAALGASDAAKQVYEATAVYAIRSGHPLVALVLAKVLEDRFGAQVMSLYQHLAAEYGAGSPKISKRGQRMAPEHPDTEIAPPDLDTNIAPAAVMAGAAKAAADFSRIVGYPQALHPIALLSELPPDAFVALCEKLTAHRLPPGAMVIREGEMGRSFFWLALGAVRVYKTDLRGTQTDLARLGEGALFGEMALIQASPRTASVQALADTDLLEIQAKDLANMADHLDKVALALDRFGRDRLLSNLMATSPIFRPFNRQQRLDLLRRFSGHEVSAGTVVVNEGDEGRGLYVVLSGEMEVTKEQEGRQIPLARLKSGDLFGEISLIKGFPATATVKAAKQSTVLFLDRVYFQRLVDALPEIRKLFEDMTQERLADTSLLLSDDLVIEEADELVLI